MLTILMLSERCEWLIDHLHLPAATGVDDAVWEPFQVAQLCNDSPFRIENKSRQIAWSWLAAAESVALAYLYSQSSAYVSINLDEAKEKIRYARQVYYSLYGVADLPKITRDNDLALEFENGARLLSMPGRPPRGKSRMNVYLDEFAHVQYDREIYTAAMPIISKGGRLSMGSSPFGASGVFWEIFTERLRKYSGYTRRTTPWWGVYAFCTNVPEALRVAPTLATSERVERYGNERIKAIYANMPEDDFQQEYECAFVDESTAWISWDEIKAVQDAGLKCAFAEGRDAAFTAIDAMADGIPRGTYELTLCGGLDIGRTKDATELYLVGITTDGRFPLRLAVTLHKTPFEDQVAVIAKALTMLPIVTLLIDQSGIGRNLAENMGSQFPAQAAGVNFTNQSKALWAGNAKQLIQQGKVPLPINRDLAYQIHSIKRAVTASKNLIFDTAASEKHHADKFWAWALAITAGKELTDRFNTMSSDDY